MNATQQTTTAPASTTPRRGRPRKVAIEPIAPKNPATCIHRLEPTARRFVERAVKALEDSAIYRTEAMSHPGSVRLYLKLKLSGLEREEFHALWLDAQNRVIAFEMMSVGSLTQTSIYPREVVKSALMHNAAACIIAHNHPSGCATPSKADEVLTKTIKAALNMVDVKLLDHFIVAGDDLPFSFAEIGLL